MPKNLLFSSATLLILFIALVGSSTDYKDGAQPVTTDSDARAAYTQMMSVLAHKRCINCHPAGDRPLQGEDAHPHNFNVQRGPDGHGVAALKCQSCHQSENNNLAGVPGAPEWHLAPRSMKWEGLSKAEIARSMLDPARNGGRSLEETVHHLTEHPLVLWAWNPGVDANGQAREKPPVAMDDYIAAVKTWAKAGAPIFEID